MVFRIFPLRSSVVLALPLLSLAACASTSPPTTAGASSCGDLQASARDEVQKALDAHASCKVDSDCVQTDFSAKCFDSCSRAVNAAGAADIDAAKAKVNSAQCVQFANHGCSATIPPCTPPQSPKCNAGTCT